MTRAHDLRPCPGCERMTSEHAEYRYSYPGELEGTEWRRASQADVALNLWRCGSCIGRDTRNYRPLGRDAAGATSDALPKWEIWP